MASHPPSDLEQMLLHLGMISPDQLAIAHRLLAEGQGALPEPTEGPPAAPSPRPALTPSQYARMQALSSCALFQHFQPLSGSLLGKGAIDERDGAFTATVRVDDRELNSLGLLPAGGYSRLMEDAVAVLGYILTGELLMPVRSEVNHRHAVGSGETLTVRAVVLKQHGRLHWFYVTVASGEHIMAWARLTALEVHSLPLPLQHKVVAASRNGRVRPEVLIEFIHLFEPELYVAAKAAVAASEVTHVVPQAENAVPAAPPSP